MSSASAKEPSEKKRRFDADAGDEPSEKKRRIDDGDNGDDDDDPRKWSCCVCFGDLGEAVPCALWPCMHSLCSDCYLGMSERNCPQCRAYISVCTPMLDMAPVNRRAEVLTVSKDSKTLKLVDEALSEKLELIDRRVRHTVRRVVKASAKGDFFSFSWSTYKVPSFEPGGREILSNRGQKNNTMAFGHRLQYLNEIANEIEAPVNNFIRKLGIRIKMCNSLIGKKLVYMQFTPKRL